MGPKLTAGLRLPPWLRDLVTGLRHPVTGLRHPPGQLRHLATGLRRAAAASRRLAAATAATRRRRMIALSASVLVVAGLVGFGLAIGLAGSGQAARPRTTTATAQRGSVVVTASAAGTLQALASRALNFSTAGVVTTLSVRPGDVVAAGQVLAQIDPTDSAAAVATAQTNVSNAQDAVTRAAEVATTPPTCPATPVQPAAQPSPSGTASPSTGPSTPPANGPSASPSPSRSGSCGGTGGSAPGGNGGSRGGGSTSDALLSAQLQLNNARLALTQAQARLTGTTISAPIAGKILAVNGTVGAQETPGSTGFLVIGGTTDITVRAMFTEADVAALAVGQHATITLPDRVGQRYTGLVSEVDLVGTVAGRLVKYGVLIAFDQVPDGLLLGQSADVAVVTRSVDDVLYVPSGAVTLGDGGDATVTVRAGGRDTVREVAAGLRGDRYTEIRSGLTAGEVVVIAGSPR